MKHAHLVEALNSDKTFFELMRRVEHYFYSTNKSELRYQKMPRSLHVIQTAELHFASSEVVNVDIRPCQEGQDGADEIQVLQRNFGLFAPYGPLPIHVTEHAWLEKKFERNSAFEDFINLISENFAWLNYRAWASMHAVLGFERQRDAFFKRVTGLAQCDQFGDSQVHPSIMACRRAYPGLYMNESRPWRPLCNMLNKYFQTPVLILPRRGRWVAVGTLHSRSEKIGSWRLGSRFRDVQQTVGIEIGPICASNFEPWMRRSSRIAAVNALVIDYTQARIDCVIDVLIKTKPEFAGRVGRMKLGIHSWLKPSHNIKRVTVFQGFEDI